MQYVKTSLPDTSWDKKPIRREAAEYKLKRIQNIIEASGDTKSVPIASELRLTTDDMEEIIRAFKTVEVPTIDEYINVEQWNESLRSSERLDTIIKPWWTILDSSATHTNTCTFRQIQHPRYSIASSVIMLAARESQNIPYSYWYNTVFNAPPKGSIRLTRLFYHAFARTLELVDVKAYDSVTVAPEERAMLIKDSPTGWYLNKWANIAATVLGDKWHYYIKHMKLGTWIFEPSVLDENSMIFHPSDWDYRPKKKIQQAIGDDLIL